MEYTDRRSCVKCEQNRKKYLLNNDRGMQIRKYEMDGGIVSKEPGFDACDNLLVLYEKNEIRLVFVELKGTDLKHAFEQIYHNIRHFESGLEANRCYARIVHTQGVPKIRNSSGQIQLERLVRKSGGNLKMKEWELKESVSKMDER